MHPQRLKEVKITWVIIRICKVKEKICKTDNCPFDGKKGRLIDNRTPEF